MMTEPPLKKLTLREVARRFEQGDDGALEDYRVHNLHESTPQSSVALQESLRTMPVARNVIQDMLKVTKATLRFPSCTDCVCLTWVSSNSLQIIAFAFFLTANCVHSPAVICCRTFLAVSPGATVTMLHKLMLDYYICLTICTRTKPALLRCDLCSILCMPELPVS